jgi:hypothetical protein
VRPPARLLGARSVERGSRITHALAGVRARPRGQPG